MGGASVASKFAVLLIVELLNFPEEFGQRNGCGFSSISFGIAPHKASKDRERIFFTHPSGFGP